MSKVNPTNFVLNQWVGACRHTPLRSPMVRLYAATLGSSASSGPTSGPSSLTTTKISEEELLKNVIEGRLVFAVRPPSNMVVGGLVGCWNIVVGFCGAPILAVGSALHALTSTPNEGRTPKPIRMLVNVCVRAPRVGLGFASLGVVTGCHQAAFGVINQIRAPAYRILSEKYWSATECGFVSPSSTPLTQHNPNTSTSTSTSTSSLRSSEYFQTPTEDIMYKAVKRSNDRAKEKDDSKGFSSSSDSNKGSKKAASRTYYDVLDVPETATVKQIKESFSSKAMKLHPDKNPRPNAHEEFDELTKAYRTLSNASKRKQYDATGGKVKDGSGGDDDMAQKKREAIRMFFGGDQLIDLVGDVRRNNFNRRFIDDADFKPVDLAVYNERMEDECLRELLSTYLDGFPEGSILDSERTTPIRVSEVNEEVMEWQTRVRRIVSAYSNVGLARQVLHAVGVEYQRILSIYGESIVLNTGVKSSAPKALLDGRSTSRTVQVVLGEKAPHMLVRNLEKLKAAVCLNPATATSNPSMVLDFIWRLSVTELEQTASRVALRAIRDVSASPQERRRRQVALAELSAIFLGVGIKYTVVDKRTIDRMTESIHDYQIKRQQSGGTKKK